MNPRYNLVSLIQFHVFSLRTKQGRMERKENEAHEFMLHYEGFHGF